MRKAIALLALAAALPATADTRFHPRQAARDDVPPGKAQCEIRLQVDDQVEVSLSGENVQVRTIAGRNARDDGSECTAPIPHTEIGGFRFEVKERRNEIRLLTPPNRANDFTAVVYIHDTDPGYGRYVFRLTWDKASATDRSATAAAGHADDIHRGDLTWNNVTVLHGRGAGAAVYNDSDERRLGDVDANIDRSGRIQVVFKVNRARPILFDGMVVSREEGRLKADAVSEDGRLRGPLYLSMDARQNITSITLDATDGRDRVKVTWERR